jgi:hypothetical protein
MKPKKEDLIIRLEGKFGKLIPAAEHCAEDIYENYGSFIDSIISKKITIVASPNLLASKLPDPKYSKYRIYVGISVLLVVASIITMFFNWKVGIGLIAASFIIKRVSTSLKIKYSLEFSGQIFSKFSNDPDEGMFDICQYYIAGILQLSSEKGKAHLPLLPSYALTGITKYARKE